ncbi:MAG: LD-carboxypeptidase [Patescibacteria group bacterium]
MKLALVDICGEGDIKNREGDEYWKRPLDLLKNEKISFLDFASGARTVEDKVQGFHDALKSDADLIWLVRGGYSCIQAFDKIDWNLVRQTAKPLYGLSDFTHLAWMAVQQGVRCYYGQGLTHFEKTFPNSSDADFLFSFLRTGTLPPFIVQPLSTSATQTDLSSAQIIGGHLVVALLMLLQYPIDLHDRYLFLEYHPGGLGEGLRDIGYYLEHLMNILKRTKNLPKGFIFGQSMLPQLDETSIPWKEINTFCAERVSRLDLPVYEIDHFKTVIPFHL